MFKPIEYFNAVNGYNIKIPEYWSKFNTYTIHYKNVNPKGTYGCYLSHYKILKNFIDDKKKNILLVLEDDASFISEFEDYLYKFINELPKKWDVLYLGWTDNGAPPKDYKEFTLKPGNRGVLTTIGYIINKQGAKKYLAEEETNLDETPNLTINTKNILKSKLNKISKIVKELKK